MAAGGPNTPPNTRAMTTRLMHQFDVDFRLMSFLSGITCTPEGNVLVCKNLSCSVRMYTPEGKIMMDLRTPAETQAWDVDCNDKYIFVTDVTSNSVLVFNYRGCLVKTNKVSNVKDIAGIAVSGDSVYITGMASQNVLKMDLSDTKIQPTQGRFDPVPEILTCPMFVCARGDVVAFSASGNGCVHCVDSRGLLKYIHGTPGQKGNPCGVVFDNDKNLFISDLRRGGICVVSDSGTVLGHIDLTGHQLSDPYGVTIDNEGNLLVACSKDAGGYCIVKFGYSFK